MGLPKENLNDFLKANAGYKLLKKCEHSILILLPNGEVLKMFDDMFLKMLSNTGFNLEKRLNEVDKFTSFNNLAKPNQMLELNGIVRSYVMPYIDGIDFSNYFQNIYDLTSYANIHSQIEDNIKTGNKLGIIFPDLCTTDNIRITPDKKVVFIDYDGLQLNQMPAVCFSDLLGDDILSSKYFNAETRLFTKELDIKSAIFLYFVDVFGVNLSKVNKLNLPIKKIFTLDDVFNIINLTDADIQQKVWKLFQPKIPNEFLGDDLYKLSEEYKLVNLYPNSTVKKLIRK